MNILQELPSTEKLGFGQFYAPWMGLASYQDDHWDMYDVVKTGPVSLSPGAKALHYAQEVFEGMKVYHTDNHVHLFRPRDYIARMAESCRILCMPPFSERDFLGLLVEVVRRNIDFIPQEPGSLYLRPTMIGTSAALGVAPAQDYQLYLLASPVGGYFGTTNAQTPNCISVWVTTEYSRAVRGGIGRAKTGGNYAASLRALTDSKKRGFDNVLFLDAVEKKWLEELSGMNVFVVEDGVLKTPPLQDTILPGVTRRTILAIAKHLGIPTAEEPIQFESLLQKIHLGKVGEVFACGTASAITCISTLGHLQGTLPVGNGKPGPISTKLYQHLIGILYGRIAPLDDQWIYPIPLR